MTVACLGATALGVPMIKHVHNVVKATNQVAASQGENREVLMQVILSEWNKFSETKKYINSLIDAVAQLQAHLIKLIKQSMKNPMTRVRNVLMQPYGSICGSCNTHHPEMTKQ